MSIRLKKVEWHNGNDFSSAMILGIPYGVKKRNGMWLVLFGGFVEPREDRNFYDRDDAKAACEQHALERIREAVEVEPDYVGKADEVPDHIRDVTKMVGWQPISTAPRDETEVLIATSGGFIYAAMLTERGWDFSGDYIVSNPTHWMPLPKPPKEVGK